jgi:hypothetical protein
VTKCESNLFDIDRQKLYRELALDLNKSHNWPSSIARQSDSSVAIWRTSGYRDWKLAMRDIAILKRDMYKYVKTRNAPLNGKPARELLGNHNPRYPSQLHFKVHRDSEGQRNYWVSLAHIPVAERESFSPNEIEMWNEIHRLLETIKTGDRTILTRQVKLESSKGGDRG